MLADKNTVVTIDLPGHGASACLDEVHTMELLAETLHRIIDELLIKRLSIMGHSMGGYVALAFLEKYHPIVETIVLLNSTTVEDSLEKKKNRDKAIKVIRKNPDLFIGMTIPNLFSEKNRVKLKKDIEILKKEALTFPPEGIIAMLKGMKIRRDRTSVLSNFKGKKYMISGLEDALFDLSDMETLSITSNSMLFKVQGGHMTVNENWNEFVKIMHFIDFL